MALRLRAETTGAELKRAIKEIEKPIAKYATATIKSAADLAKRGAKDEISNAGFSARSSNNLKYELDPPRGESINISATFKFRTGYFNIFEQGGTIQGKPLLWLPLETVPFGRGRKRLTPKEYSQRLGPLFRARGSKPLLVGAVSRAGVTRATRDRVSLRRRAVRSGSLQGQNVPLYIGVPSVKIPKKFNVTAVIQRVAAEIPRIYNAIVFRDRG